MEVLPPRGAPSSGSGKFGGKRGAKPTASGSALEETLKETYAGKGLDAVPTTMMFDHVSPATRLLEKRRQMFEVQEALNAQKDEFARREDAFRRREDGLRRKDLELQESLIKFNKFLQENESKRNRALKRAAEERKQREAKELEIKRLEAELASKLKEELELKERVERNIQYQDFLEGLCQSMSKYFPEISDILNRHDTLVKANVDLLLNKQSQELISESLQREYLEYKKEGENKELNSNNTIAELQAQLESKRKHASSLQADIDQVVTDSGDRALTLGQILSSVSNTLNRCEAAYRIRHNKPMLEQNAEKEAVIPLRDRYEAVIHGKLSEMAQFLVDLQDIKEEFKVVRYKYESGAGVGGVDASQSLTVGSSSRVME
jgi:hypothetical protein